ncbi:DNA primase [bacterium]|nr:MAG: DNA primase [bacterium]
MCRSCCPRASLHHPGFARASEPPLCGTCPPPRGCEQRGRAGGAATGAPGRGVYRPGAKIRTCVRVRCPPRAHRKRKILTGSSTAAPANVSSSVAIADSVLSEIQARLPLVEVVGSYVQLRKRGKDYVGLCPFHSERTPSFSVAPEKGFFKCFGCGQGGGLFKFIELIENVSFPDAIRLLAKRAGVEVEEETPAMARRRSEREAIYEANAAAVAYFQEQLRKGADDGAGRRYCAKRGLSDATLEAFKIGYAPDRWDGLTGYLRDLDIDLSIAARAGLVKPGQRGYYDFYRGRLMIPTYAATGETIAFGGRALGDQEPKYLNTAGTPVYTKGRHLFALNLARRAIAKAGFAILVEGYLDCIALHEAGFTHAVASLGTSFTAEQAGELHRYAQRAYLCFDGDGAGAGATVKSVDVLRETGVQAQIVLLPAGEDPDSFVRGQGAPAFAALLEAAVPWESYKIERAYQRIRAGSASRAEVLRAVTREIAEIDELERDYWLVQLCGRLGVDPQEVRASRFLAQAWQRSERSVSAFTRYAPPLPAKNPREREFLAALLAQPALLETAAGAVRLEAIEDPVYRRLYGALLEQRGKLEAGGEPFTLFAGDDETSGALADVLSSTAATVGQALAFEALEEQIHRFAQDLAARADRTRLSELEREIERRYVQGEEVPAGLREQSQAIRRRLQGKR